MNAASWLESFPAQERWRALLLKEGPRLATWALALGLGVQAAFIVTDLAGAGRRGTTAPARAAASGLLRSFAQRGSPAKRCAGMRTRQFRGIQPQPMANTGSRRCSLAISR